VSSLSGEQYGAAAGEVLVVRPDGSVLLNPAETVLARCIGPLSSHGELLSTPT
jgi:thioredoxin reductase (NADPH)